MKKLIISSILLLFTIAGFSQKSKPVNLDSLVSVSLPENYSKKDTLGQHILSANGTFGYMVVVKVANNKPNEPLQKEKDLNNVFKTYVEGVQNQYQGSSAQNVRDTTVGALKAKAFTLQNDAGGGDIQLKNFLMVYTTAATYIFEYGYSHIRSDVISAELKAFISSIKFSPKLQRTDQYLSSTGNGMSQTVKIALFGGGGLLLIAIVVITISRRKRAQLG